MVFASNPVASVMRLAARPVGAQSRSSVPLAARIRKTALIIVVLPTPGPPVITTTLDFSASRMAVTWLSARLSPTCFSTQGSALSGSIEGHAHEFLRHLEQLLGERSQRLGWQSTVPLVHGLSERVGNSGSHAHHSGLLDAEFHGDGVRRLETNAADVAREPVRIFGHDLDRVGTVGLEDAHRARRTDTM